MSLLQQIYIIYGTAWKKENTRRLTVAAILSGFRAIDTACQPKHYREDLVGAALEDVATEHNIQRDQLFLQTKFTPIGGHDRTQPLPYNPASSITDQVRDSFQKSLENLRTTYIDSYILHSPLNTMERTLEAWKVLCSLQDQGLVGNIGVSNTYSVETLQLLEKEGGRRPQVVQNRWYEGNAFDRDVVKYCREKGIFYQSFWTITGSPSLQYHPEITALASKKGVEPAQMIYKIVQCLGIIPLAGSTQKQHMEDGVATKDIVLSDDEIPEEVCTLTGISL